MNMLLHPIRTVRLARLAISMARRIIETGGKCPACFARRLLRIAEGER